jgi:hypothetical protein
MLPLALHPLFAVSAYETLPRFVNAYKVEPREPRREAGSVHRRDAGVHGAPEHCRCGVCASFHLLRGVGHLPPGIIALAT